jgi:RND family efflux transporter MFP subunit
MKKIDSRLKELFIKPIFIITTIFLITACEQKVIEKDNIKLVTSVVTTTIERESVVRYHEVPAVFLAENRADLSFQLSGTVDQVLVKIGDQVEKGQVLMGIYNPNLDPTLVSNLADLESVKAQISQVKKDVASFKELIRNNSTSKNSLEHKETDLKELMARKKSINAQIVLAQANQLESLIHAPFDSIVSAVNKQLGEFVQVGQVVISVNQQQYLEVEVNITKLLWDNLKLNDIVKGIYADNIVEFRVTELSRSANNNSHLMKVILQLNTSVKNAIGQQVILRFPQIYADVYKLPLEVIVDDGINSPYLFTLQDGKAHKTPIKPIYVDDDEIVFSSDNIHEPVVIKGQSKISTGMRLRSVQ